MADKQVDRQFSLSQEQLSSSFLHAIPETDTHRHVALEGSVNNHNTHASQPGIWDIFY